MSPAVERIIGSLLRPVRAGDGRLVWNDNRIGAVPATIRLTSPAFAEGGAIPARHAGRGVGDNLSPALAWSAVPAGTAELVLIMQDPDAPLPRPVLHLLAGSIAPDRTGLGEGALSRGADGSIVLGRGSFGRIGYAGPRPVCGHGAHRYVFQVLALADRLPHPEGFDLAALLPALAGKTLARGKLIGMYERV